MCSKYIYTFAGLGIIVAVNQWLIPEEFQKYFLFITGTAYGIVVYQSLFQNRHN